MDTKIGSRASGGGPYVNRVLRFTFICIMFFACLYVVGRPAPHPCFRSLRFSSTDAQRRCEVDLARSQGAAMVAPPNGSSQACREKKYYYYYY